jgi:cystathionine gamma-synthase
MLTAQFRRRCVSGSSICKLMSTTSKESGPQHLLPCAAGAASYALSEKLAKEHGSVVASISTILSHAGLPMSHDSKYNQPLSPPINLATTYERPPDGNYAEDGWIYSRESNPTRKLLEDVMGQLETTSATEMSNDDSCKHADGYAFSSGMAAIASLLLAHKSPVKVLIPTDVYHGLLTQFAKVLSDHGVLHSSVDMTNCEALKSCIEKEMSTDAGRYGSLIVWMETPSNPLCQVIDIKTICDMVEEIRQSTDGKFRITTVVDSTWAPPFISQPLKLGADVVAHSGTKYLGGHSDVLLGIVCTSPFTRTGKWLSERVRGVQTSIGSVPSPFECWLTLRGLRTLHLRVERCSRSALELAQFLESHPHVVKCHYPGLRSHPHHDIATNQMKGIASRNEINLYGGMLSFELESEAMAMAVAAAVRVIRRATSLGGTESLIEHRFSIEPPERRVSPEGLLRVSVGLEDVNDLKEDLERALRIAAEVVHTNVK